LAAGLPSRLPGRPVNPLCASGRSAGIAAARALSCGEGRGYLAGGAASMCPAPVVMGNAASGISPPQEVVGSPLGPPRPTPPPGGPPPGVEGGAEGDCASVKTGWSPRP
ncbi:hypothetical protein OFL68_15970, partial [Pseudomonas aeruginosa]|nr:hypothetical protein [Pseudomonas aeruginosa]